MPEDESLVPDQRRQTMWALRPDALARVAEVARRGTDLQAGELTRKAAVRQENESGVVAVVPLQGLITPHMSLLSLLFGGGGGLDYFREEMHRAVSDSEVSAVVINVDSPGGYVDMVPETAAEIRDMRGAKPIVAVANTMAASAAYWLASQADELIVTPSGEVGSIGVFVGHEDWSRYDERIGVKTTLIHAGKYKIEGNPYEPLSEEARDAIQADVDTIYELFLEDVAAGRDTTVDKVRGEYGEGRMALANAALDQGMVDRVDTLESTITRLMGGGAPTRSALRASSDQPRPDPEPEPDPDPDPDPELVPATALGVDERKRLIDALA